ncbi:hypothetical protein DSM106972_072810 [Dulcicalothrix desertica PCC 7102]|uniref:DUF4132 domain-containing protein n=1 Tax=Dulcicalothrix desertica PCC 7102 TaxID=232991 RepID=A0A433V450_9CYAN|nr:DUF4132 domain-containing protein [Dulcicalothrix desertica]RUT00872.1 hypothetical protein DSM106972_072810 [Dulcicalothrix desertica PCC 7102]TWH42291.1 uncharacterized protein DUF4132 [Dulcicalothrix desertica PCC 7102]
MREQLDITARVEINPEDWFWATWRPRNPLARPQPKPFDKKDALLRLEKIFVRSERARQPSTRYFINWQKASISSALSKQEAHFWFTAMTHSLDNTDSGIQALVQSLNNIAFTGNLSVELITSKLIWSGGKNWRSPELVLAIANLCLIDEVISSLVDISLLDSMELFGYSEAQYNLQEFLADHSYNPLISNDLAIRIVAEKIRSAAANTLNNILIPGLHRYVLPYLNDNELRELREKLVPILEKAPQGIALLPSHVYYRDQWLKQLPAYLGMHDEVKAFVESLPNPHSNIQDPLPIIFGLGSAELVETHVRRLKILLTKPVHVRAWLAHTEYRALDWVRDSILKAENKEQAVDLFEILALVKASENALQMLTLIRSSKVPELARQWLEEHPNYTVVGLIPVVAGDSQLASIALEVLRDLKQQGHGELIANAIKHEKVTLARKIQIEVLESEKQQEQYFDEATTPQWLHSQMRSLNKTQLPEWVLLKELPSINIENNKLNDNQIIAVLQALRKSTLDSCHPLIQDIKLHAQRKSLDDFVWRLFELWLNDGGTAKEKWGMTALGLVGSDAVALKLAPLIRKWPGESFHQRAVLGLECLRAIASDTALMLIHSIAEKVKFRALKTKANECMQSIAQERKLTREQLEDRIIPDCGLNEKGTKIFDYGSRQFYFVLGAELKPMVRDANGKRFTNLPKPGKQDDIEKAQQATEDWKLLKKQLSQMLKIQATRLELAMCNRRQWAVTEFELLLVQHPLMSHLVQQLIWGKYNTEGKLINTFRVAEDYTYCDSHDNEILLSKNETVGIVHPIYLSLEEKAAWGQILSDYEIFPAFPQINREIYTLEPGETDKYALTRFEDIYFTYLAGRPGWARSYEGVDNGYLTRTSREFSKAYVRAVIGGEEKGCCFYPTKTASRRLDVNDIGAIRLGDIDPLVISEVIRDLTLLT